MEFTDNMRLAPILSRPAASSPLNAMAEIVKYLSGRIVLPVFLLDNSRLTLLIEPTSTVYDVTFDLAKKIGFPDPEDDCLCFSLHEVTDNVTLGRALPPSEIVLHRMQRWESAETCKFVMQCKLFTETMINSEDKKIVRMLFIQSVYNVISGNYPTTKDEAVNLGALQFRAKFGAHNPGTHKPGFLGENIREYIPGPHLRNPENAGMSVADWEALLFAECARQLTDVPMQAYTTIIKQRDYFGAVLFGVKQRFTRKLPRKLFMAISRAGIILVRIPRTLTEGEMETLMRFPLHDIYRWAYKPNENFYFEIKPATASGSGDSLNQQYRFLTEEGQHMSDLLTDYALALLREMGLNSDGTKRVRGAEGAAAADEESASSASGSSESGSGSDSEDEEEAARRRRRKQKAKEKKAKAKAKAKAKGKGLGRSADAFADVDGDAGALATAATRSGKVKSKGKKKGAAAAGGGGRKSVTRANSVKPPSNNPPRRPSRRLPGAPPPPPDSDEEDFDSSDDEDEGAITDPEEEEEEEEEEEAEEQEEAGEEEAEEEDGSASAEEEEKLPPNWEKHYAEDEDAWYFFNTVTGESSWEVPEE